MNLPDSQLCFKSKTGPSVAKGQKYIEKSYTCRGGHRTYFLDGGTIGVGKNISWVGGTPHILFDGANNWVGTPHNIERTRHPSNSSFLTSLTSIWSAGWPAGSVRKYNHFVAPSCKLKLARFSA